MWWHWKKKIAKIRFRFPAVVRVSIDPVIRNSRTLTELVYKAHADNQRQLLTLKPAVSTIDGVILLRRCNRSLLYIPSLCICLTDYVVRAVKGVGLWPLDCWDRGFDVRLLLLLCDRQVAASTTS